MTPLMHLQAAIAFHQPGAGIKARLAEIQNDILSIQVGTCMSLTCRHHARAAQV